MPTWSVPENIYDGDFRIDEIIRTLSKANPGLRERWRGREDRAVAFGRRALEVAIMKGADAWREANLGPVIQDWAQLASAAEKAQEALRTLNKVLNQGKRPKSVDDLQTPLRFCGIFAAMPMAAKAAAASESAVTLWGAYGLVERIAIAAHSLERALSAGRQNPGEPGALAFAVVLGEAWVYLTGQRPAASKQGGPFQRFLAAAWSDAGGTVTAGSAEGSRLSGDFQVTAFLRLAEAARDRFPPGKIADELKHDLGPDWA